MISALAQNAIDAALKGRWQEAAEANLQILKTEPKDVDALNRLARAYEGLGDISKARATAEKTLRIDKINTIAAKNLKRWRKKKSVTARESGNIKSKLFLEEPGKTKIVQLLNLGAPELITTLIPGEEVQIICHQHRVCVSTVDDKYIGRLADDLAANLKYQINQGGEYVACIKQVGEDQVKVFIAER